jgi:DNA primase
MNGLDFARVNAAALSALPELLNRWLPDGRKQGAEWVARNPVRSDRRPGSFSVNTRTGRWADFATGERGGDVISLAAYLHGLRQAEAARKLADMLGLAR